MSRRAEGMVVVVTGASAGIGRALAEQLSAAGAVLTLAARRVDRLESLNTLLGGKHQVLKADVSHPDECQKLIDDAVAGHGRIDTLVCNAGYGLAKSTADTTADEYHRIFQTNVFGTTDVIRAAIPVMRNQNPRDDWRGQIVIVSSAIARRGLPYSGAYAATKAAQLSIAEALRVELKPAQIAVTSVHPVGTDTEFFDLADENGRGTVTRPARGEIRQSAETVAAKIVAAIIKPKPEVWPAPFARLGLSIGTLVPGMVDKAVVNYRKPVVK